MFYSSAARGGNYDFKGSGAFLRLTLWLTQGFMDELTCRIEELGDIESRLVIDLHAKVLDAQVTVVIGTSQHIVPLSLRCIENVRHPELLQMWSLQRRFPATLNTLSVRLPPAVGLRLLYGSSCLLTHPQCTRWAKPGQSVCTEPRSRSRTAALGLMSLV